MYINPLSLSPRVVGIVSGLCTGVVMAALNVVVYRESWSWRPAVTVLLVLATAIATGLWIRYIQRQVAEIAYGLSWERAKAAYRAGRRGPIPTDPRVRTTAQKIAEWQLKVMLQARNRYTVLGILLVLVEGLQLLDPPVRWLELWPVPTFVLLMINLADQCRRQRRRVAQLRG
jgi:hypothetical protein